MSSTPRRARRRGERPVIYGRDRERAQLGELLDSAIEGYGSLALISGEAGIGKTTLVDDLIYEAEQRDFLVLIGGCYDMTTTPPYGPWSEALQQYRQENGLPKLPAWFSNPERLEQVGSQGALLEETRQFLKDVADQRSVLIVIEDLHWSDSASLEMLRYLARRSSDSTSLVVTTYRDDEVTRQHELYSFLPLLIRESRPERVHLRRLGNDDTARLIEEHYGLSSADAARLNEYIQERSEGNPLFASELLSGLEDDGTLTRANGGWKLAPLAEVSMPPLLQQVIEGRLQRLDQDVRDLLEIASVIGHEVPIDLWQQVSGRDNRDLNPMLATTIEMNVLEESEDGVTMTFRHALIREALLLSISPLERRDLHRKVADVLVSQPQVDPDAVVTHLEHAFDPRSLEWLIKAGDRAIRSYAWDVAIERYERGLELVERQTESDLVQHCDILLALGEAQNHATAGRLATGSRPALGGGGSYAGRDTFRRAADIARRGGTPEQFAEAALGVVGFNPSPQQGGIVGIRLLEEALERLPTEDSPLRVRLLSRVSLDSYLQAAIYGTLSLTGEFETQIQSRCEAAVAMARRLNDPESLAYALIMRNMLLNWYLDEDWLDPANEAAQMATLAGDRPLLAWALLQKADALERRGDLSAQRTAMDQLTRIADDLRLPFFLWIAACLEATVALASGRFADAEHYIEEADRNQSQSGWGTVLLVSLLREQGELDVESEKLLFPRDRLVEVVRSMNPFYEPYALLHQLIAGERDQASEGFAAYVARVNASGGFTHRRYGVRRWLTWAAEVCTGLGDVEAARPIYDALLPQAGRIVQHTSSENGGCASYHLGLLATMLELWDNAEAHFDEAARLNEQWGYRLHVANTRYAWGEMLLKWGRAEDRERAYELLEQARALADEIGSVRMQRLVDELLPQQPVSRIAYPSGLTQREVEVLRLVARGMTDAEIAEELFISPRTVSQHLRNAYNKLGVNNRAEATRVVVEQGIA